MGAWARAGWRVWDLGNGTIMLQKLSNPEWQITSKSFLLSSFLIGFSFSPTAEIPRLELEFEESLRRKTASIFQEGIGQESNGAANQEKQIFLLCQISPSASSTRDLGARLAEETHAYHAIRKKLRHNCAIQGERLIWKQKIWLAICELLCSLTNQNACFITFFAFNYLFSALC